MVDLLEGIFGSKTKARLIRFLILNGEEWHTIDTLMKKNRLRKDETRKMLALLEKMKCILKKSQQKEMVYSINKDFLFYSELFNLISSASRYPQCQSLKSVRSIGDVRLVMVSGIFLNYTKGKIDLLMVANHVSRAKLVRFMQNIEAELGREIRYVLLDTEEFKYRIEMVDRFLMDFFEGPHEDIVNRITNFKRMLSTLKR